MTQTLTTEQLKAIAEEELDACATLDAAKLMARELLANREAQPVAGELGEIRIGRLPTMNQEEYPGLGDWWVQLRIGSSRDEILARVYGATPDEAVARARALTAPPAPAVPDKPRLPPHVYRDLLDMLQEAAIAYGGTQQLLAQLSSALSIHVQPDHPHTRAPMLAAAPEGGK